MAAPADTSGYVETPDGVQIFQRTLGTGPETLFVLHGGPGFAMDYLVDDIAPLAKHLRLVFHDQRGTGRSSLVAGAPGLHAQRLVEDLDALRGRFGLERINLLGHSWGAGLVALYALRYPEHVGRIVLVGPIPPHRRGLVQTFEHIATLRSAEESARLKTASDAWRADPGNADTCRAFYRIWYAPFFGDRSMLERTKGDFCAGTPAALRNKVEQVDRYTLESLGDYDWRSALRTVNAPTLVVHGAKDVISVAHAREWTAALPDSRMLLLEGIGHFPYLEAPERFFDPVAAFVRSGQWPTTSERGTRP